MKRRKFLQLFGLGVAGVATGVKAEKESNFVKLPIGNIKRREPLTFRRGDVTARDIQLEVAERYARPPIIAKVSDGINGAIPTRTNAFSEQYREETIKGFESSQSKLREHVSYRNKAMLEAFTKKVDDNVYGALFGIEK